MARPSQIDEQRKKLLPIVCEVFSELGYRRTTTAELAQRCGVRENILYRLWQNKKAMFLATIDYIFQSRSEQWSELMAKRPTPREAAEALIAYEAEHQGEFGFSRVVFTALVEADDPDIREAITSMYRRFHERIHKFIEASWEGANESPGLSGEATAWAMIGLATVSNVVRELDLLGPEQRKDMFRAAARYLLEES